LRASSATTLALETMWRTSARDGVYGPGGGVIRAPGTSVARHVGDDIDAGVYWQLDAHAAASVAFGYFLSGDFIRESGAARDMSYITTTFFYRF